MACWVRLAVSRPPQDIMRLPERLLLFHTPVTRRKGENPEKGVSPSQEVPEEFYPFFPSLLTVGTMSHDMWAAKKAKPLPSCMQLWTLEKIKLERNKWITPYCHLCASLCLAVTSVPTFCLVLLRMVPCPGPFICQMSTYVFIWLACKCPHIC